MASLNNIDDKECDQVKTCLFNQFKDVWNFLSYHLQTLSTAECLWRPGKLGTHLYQDESGNWRGKLPIREDYDIGPSSIGWVSWHIIFWWSMTLNHSFGDQTLKADHITWPGNAESLKIRLNELKDEWLEAIETLDPRDMATTSKSWGPVQGKSMSAIIGWVNTELMKNAAELGYIRYLYTQR